MSLQLWDGMQDEKTSCAQLLYSISQEFEGATWENQAGNVVEDGQLWQDNWEDDDTNDDFSNQLRSIIEAKNNGQQ